MLCIIFNEQKETLSWKFGVVKQDLRQWAKETMGDGDTVKYFNEELSPEQNINKSEIINRLYKFISYGKR